MLFTCIPKAKATTQPRILMKKLLALFMAFNLYSLPLTVFALDSSIVLPSTSNPMPSALSPKCSFNFVDTYDGTVMPQGPLATISTTPGAATQLKFYNNGTPTQTLSVSCTGYYQVLFSIELQSNKNVPVINITNLSVSPVYPSGASGNSFVIYPQCNNIVLKYTNVPTDASLVQTMAYLYYDTTQTPNLMVLAYRDGGNNVQRVTIPANSNGYASILSVLTGGTQVLTDAQLQSLYTIAVGLVPQPNTPILPYCVVQTISGAATANLTQGATISAPSFVTDSSVSVLGGEFSVVYLGPCQDDKGIPISPKPYFCP